jgi:putative N6-adenine-specific DNA methylase
MCGSGTIPIEAAMIGANIAPGDLKMSYGFQKWKDYDPTLFNKIVTERSVPSRDLKAMIFASDISEDFVKLSRRHAQNAGVLRYIKFSSVPLSEVIPPSGPGTVIVNPPYGERVVQENLNDLYKQIGDILKKSYEGYDAWILSGNADAMKNVGLRPSPKVILYNGQLECRFNRYSLYQGSKKEPNLTVS